MIEYITGDLLTSDADVRCHQVNCQSIMHRGLGKQVKEKYPEVFKEYYEICSTKRSAMLGKAQFVDCNDGKVIANLFAQDKYGRDQQFTDYNAVDSCLAAVYGRVSRNQESVAFPLLMGCDRCGGDWKIVLGLIEKYFKDSSVKCSIVILQ